MKNSNENFSLNENVESEQGHTVDNDNCLAKIFIEILLKRNVIFGKTRQVHILVLENSRRWKTTKTIRVNRGLQKPFSNKW